MTDTSELIRRFSIALAILGVLVAGYLTWAHIDESTALCSEGGGCDIVRQSPYSQIVGIPVAAIGALGYLFILGVLMLEGSNGPLADSGPVLVFGLSLVGALYSAYLTYLELFVINALCPHCVASAIIMAALFVLALSRVCRVLRTEPVRD
jgi:uncharacterized membrane protein